MLGGQTARTNPNYLQKNLSQYHFVYNSHNTPNIPYIMHKTENDSIVKVCCFHLLIYLQLSLKLVDVVIHCTKF